MRSFFLLRESAAAWRFFSSLRQRVGARYEQRAVRGLISSSAWSGGPSDLAGHTA